MAASTAKGVQRGPEVHTGEFASVISASETNQLKAIAGKLGQIIVWDVGTSWTIDVYDDADSNDNQVWAWITADGVGVFALQCPMANGIRIVTGGTAGAATVVWS